MKTLLMLVACVALVSCGRFDNSKKVKPGNPGDDKGRIGNPQNPPGANDPGVTVIDPPDMSNQCTDGYNPLPLELPNQHALDPDDFDWGAYTLVEWRMYSEIVGQGGARTAHIYFGLYQGQYTRLCKTALERHQSFDLSFRAPMYYEYTRALKRFDRDFYRFKMGNDGQPSVEAPTPINAGKISVGDNEDFITKAVSPEFIDPSTKKAFYRIYKISPDVIQIRMYGMLHTHVDHPVWFVQTYKRSDIH